MSGAEEEPLDGTNGKFSPAEFALQVTKEVSPEEFAQRVTKERFAAEIEGLLECEPYPSRARIEVVASSLGISATAIAAELKKRQPADSGEQWPSAQSFTEERLAAAIHPPCLVDRYLYRNVGVLAGASGSNKTTLAILHIALGRPLYGLDTERSRTLYVTSEDAAEEMALTLRELMLGLSLSASERSEGLDSIRVVDVVGKQVRLCDVGRGGNVSVSRDVGSFIERYQDLSPGIVYFDPLASFGPSEELGNAGLQGVIFAARRIMRAMNCCVRIVHHTGQQSFRETMRDQYAMRGATSLSDGYRMVAVLTRAKLDDNSPFGADDSSYVLSRPKLRFCKPQGEIFIKRDGFRFEWSHRIDESPEETDRHRATQLEHF
ncbi:MAG: AAA family ATPase [Thermodesulfobacteriota bacterium]